MLGNESTTFIYVQFAVSKFSMTSVLTPLDQFSMVSLPIQQCVSLWHALFQLEHAHSFTTPTLLTAPLNSCSYGANALSFNFSYKSIGVGLRWPVQKSWGWAATRSVNASYTYHQMRTWKLQKGVFTNFSTEGNSTSSTEGDACLSRLLQLLPHQVLHHLLHKP